MYHFTANYCTFTKKNQGLCSVLRLQHVDNGKLNKSIHYSVLKASVDTIFHISAVHQGTP